MKKEYSFTVAIEPCKEGGYFGTCPSIPGCHVQGETYEETLRELKAAIKAMIEDDIESDAQGLLQSQQDTLHIYSPFDR